MIKPIRSPAAVLFMDLLGSVNGLMEKVNRWLGERKW